MIEVGEAWPYLAMTAGALVTYLFRAVGVLLSGRLDPESPIFAWVAAVAYALLAGLIARMIVLPVGPLEATPLVGRLAAAALALTLFFLTRHNLVVGIAAGAGTLILFTWAGV